MEVGKDTEMKRVERAVQGGCWWVRENKRMQYGGGQDQPGFKERKRKDSPWRPQPLCELLLSHQAIQAQTI